MSSFHTYTCCQATTPWAGRGLLPTEPSQTLAWGCPEIFLTSLLSERQHKEGLNEEHHDLCLILILLLLGSSVFHSLILLSKVRDIHVQWWFINLGSYHPEISLIRTKSMGTDFRSWTDEQFSNPEKSLIRKYRPGTNVSGLTNHHCTCAVKFHNNSNWNWLDHKQSLWVLRGRGGGLGYQLHLSDWLKQRNQANPSVFGGGYSISLDGKITINRYTSVDDVVAYRHSIRYLRPLDASGLKTQPLCPITVWLQYHL